MSVTTKIDRLISQISDTLKNHEAKNAATEECKVNKDAETMYNFGIIGCGKISHDS